MPDLPLVPGILSTAVEKKSKGHNRADADSICDDSQSADASASEYCEDGDSDSSSSDGDYDQKKKMSSNMKNKRRQVSSTNTSKKKNPAQVSSTKSSTKKRKRTNASTTTTTSNDSTTIETLVKVRGNFTPASIMKVLDKYDEMKKKDGSYGIYARVARKFHDINRKYVGTWVKNRHQYKSTERADGSVSIESNNGKRFTKDECVRLLDLFRQYPNNLNMISEKMRRKPDACQDKHDQLMKENQITRVEQFRNLPDGFLELLNHKIVDGNKVSILYPRA
jgi:hypothetical protein